MVLLGFSVDVSESELRGLCDCTPFGTETLKAIDAARSLGFIQTSKHTLTIAELQQELSRGLYPIVYVNLLPLDGIKGEHALVVIEMSEESITVYDPLHGEREIILSAFETAWATMHNLAILVQR
jgi:ABC-type bacteriocin/lantibiotic exporter with double-glycine peptidase domain